MGDSHAVDSINSVSGVASSTTVSASETHLPTESRGDMGHASGSQTSSTATNAALPPLTVVSDIRPAYDVHAVLSTADVVHEASLEVITDIGADHGVHTSDTSATYPIKATVSPTAKAPDDIYRPGAITATKDGHDTTETRATHFVWTNPIEKGDDSSAESLNNSDEYTDETGVI